MIVFERRACAILYNILRARSDLRPFLLPANVCPIVPVTFFEAGQPFELVDICADSLEMNRHLAQERLQASDHAGVLFVRPYGSDRDATSLFMEFRSVQSDLCIIDDKCLCRPDAGGRSVSPVADVTLFSTGHAKYADLGIGGFAHLADGVVYRNERGLFDHNALTAVKAAYERAISHRTAFTMRAAGWLDLGEPATSWSDHRRLVGETLAAVDSHKEAINAIYERGLPAEIQLSRHFQNWRFNIRLPDATGFVRAVFAAGLFASRHYASLGGIFAKGTFPEAGRLHASIVNLFNDRNFDVPRARRMVDLVLRHLDGAGQ